VSERLRQERGSSRDGGDGLPYSGKEREGSEGGVLEGKGDTVMGGEGGEMIVMSLLINYIDPAKENHELTVTGEE
jgi:hypothetical protein